MKNIATALVKAKGEFGPALKGKTNPAFKSKYADLAACLDAVDDALIKHGVFMYQETFEDNTGVTVETVFLHTDGETLRCGKLHVPAGKQDPQGYGSALSYARRYSLMAACGIAAEDDDGEAARKAAAAAKEAAEKEAAITDAIKKPPVVVPLVGGKFNLAASLKWIAEAATQQESITRARNAYAKAETDEERKAIQELGNSYKEAA